MRRKCQAPPEVGPGSTPPGEVQGLSRSVRKIGVEPLALNHFETLWARQNAHRLYRKQNDPVSAARITPTQIGIPRLVAQGTSDAEIASALGISAHTAHRHVASILLRLDAPTRAAAATQAVFAGLIRLSPFAPMASTGHSTNCASWPVWAMRWFCLRR